MRPVGLHKNPSFSQVVVTQGKVRTVYISGQNPVNSSGEIIGRGDIWRQTEQVFNKLKIVLSAAGAQRENVSSGMSTLSRGNHHNPHARFFGASEEIIPIHRLSQFCFLQVWRIQTAFCRLTSLLSSLITTANMALYRPAIPRPSKTAGELCHYLR